MPPFDPDAYLAKQPFDPDAYLAQPPAGVTPTDAWSKSVSPPPFYSGQSVRAAPEDKYRAAAIAARDEAARKGLPLLEGYTDRAGKGVGFGWADDLMAGVGVVPQMIQRGTLNPAEAYRYSRAREDVRQEEMSKATAGPLGAAAELAGGFATGAGAFGGTRAAARAIPFTSRQIPAGVMNAASNVGRGAGLGAVLGAGEAPTWQEIPRGAAIGAGVGGGLAAAMPAVGAAITPAARTLQFTRLRDPEKVGIETIAKTMRSAGITPEELRLRVTDAAMSGQPYTAADAIGKEGVRALTAMGKVPGQQRQEIAEFIAQRNLGMPYRTGEEVGRGLGAPGTAAQAREALVERASREAGPVYRQAETVPTWSERIQEFIDDPIARGGLRHGVELQRLRSVGSDRPFRPEDAMITGFNEAGDPIITGVPNMQTLHTLKVGLDRMIENEVNPATGRLNARGNALMGFRNRMLEEIDAINPTYAEARRIYSDPMRTAQAVETGRTMVGRGRPADTVPAYRALSPNEQEGVRIGYADAVREPLERTGNFPGILREKSPKGVAELAEMSQYQGPRLPGRPDQLRRFLTREEEMLRTGTNVTGGPATAENLADIAAQPSSADVFGMARGITSGNPLSLVQSAWEMAKAIGKGESEAQRVAITRALLTNEPEAVRALADRVAAHELRRRGVNPWQPDRPPRYAPGQ